MKRSDLAHLKWSMINHQGLTSSEAEIRINELLKLESESNKPEIKRTFRQESIKLKEVKDAKRI